MIGEIDRLHRGGAFRGGAGRQAGDAQFVRAVVLRSYAPGEEAQGWPDYVRTGVTCDVLVYANRMRMVVPRVPVCLPGAGGVADGHDWMPRGTTRSLGGGALVIQGSPGAVTPAHDLDGDNVLIAFMGGYLDHPVIVGSLPHPRRNVVPSEGWPLRRRVRGAVVGVDASGSIVVDTSAASTGVVGADGAEDSSGIGDLTATVKGDAALTVGGDLDLAADGDVSMAGSAVDVRASLSGRVTLGRGGSPQPAMLSRAFLTDLSTFLGGLQTIVTPLTGTIPGLAGLIAGITASLALGPPYLSQTTEND